MTSAELITAIQAGSVLVAGIVSVLAWIAKIRWSREFAAAKDETIKSKDAEIQVWKDHVEVLRSLNPPTLVEYVTKTRELIEIATKAQVGQFKERVETLERELIKAKGDAARVSSLTADRDRLVAEVKRLQVSSDDAERYLEQIAKLYLENTAGIGTRTSLTLAALPGGRSRTYTLPLDFWTIPRSDLKSEPSDETET